MKDSIRNILAGVGINATDEVIDKTLANYDMLMEQLNELGEEELPPFDIPESDDVVMAGEVMVTLGLGDYNYETGEWKPLSGDVYAFDVEVFDIDRMYTLFLRGVESIVPGISFADITEDTSGLTEEFKPSENPFDMETDGMRSFSFTLNGNRYSAELESYGDWFNMEAIAFMNSVLEKEGYAGRLHVAGGSGQIVVLIYGEKERAEKIMGLFTPEFE